MKLTKVVMALAVLFFVASIGTAQTQSKTDTTKVQQKMMKKEMHDMQKKSGKKDEMKHEMKEGMHDMMHHSKTDSTNTDEAVIWNKVCPVQGEEVDTEAPTVEYKGKLIGFCCPGCDKKFRKDPERYMKNLSEDGTTYVKK